MKKIVDCASVPCRLPEDTAREVDALVKTLPAGCEYITKTVGVEYQFEPGERAEVSILTSATVDMSNEVVLPEGLDLESYRKSRVVLWNHDKNKPVATCEWIKLFHGAIRAKTVYPERPEDVDTPWFTDDVWAMTKSVPPILRCKSIGGLPLLPMREPTPEELEKHPEWAGAGVWEKILMTEYSCVYAGCNQDALVEAINTKSLDPAKLKIMGVEVPQLKEVITIDKFRAVDFIPALTGTAVEVTPVAKVYTREELESLVKEAVPFKKRKVKKPFDMNAFLAKVEERLDWERIMKMANSIHKNRHRA